MKAHRPVRRAIASPFASCLASLLTILLATAPTPTMAIQEPAYRVVRTIEEVEVRDYPPYTVAEVEVDGPAGDAGSQAFPVLFGYISGKNAGEQRLTMTAPVVQTAADPTVPVIQSAVRSPANRTVVQFVLPKGITRDAAPVPGDPRVHLRDVPAKRYAVIRYAGFWSDANYGEHLARLETVVASNGLHVAGEPVFARYDPPFKPWFMRRNEIWLPIASP